MLKINVGLSRKITEDYNSRGFSLNIEGELPSDLLHDPRRLEESTDQLFELANRLLDDQVNQAIRPTAKPSNGNGHSRRYDGPTEQKVDRRPTSNQNGNGNGHNSERQLTQAQGRAITNMTRKLGVSTEDWLEENFQVYEVGHLSLKLASQAIDRLKKELETQGVRQ